MQANTTNTAKVIKSVTANIKKRFVSHLEATMSSRNHKTTMLLPHAISLYLLPVRFNVREEVP